MSSDKHPLQMEAVEDTPPLGAYLDVSLLSATNQNSKDSDWVRCINSSGVVLGEKIPVTPEELLELLQKNNTVETPVKFIFKKRLTKHDDGITHEESVTPENLSAILSNFFNYPDSKKYQSFIVDVVSNTTDNHIFKRYKIENIHGKLYVSNLVTSKSNFKQELVAYLGNDKEKEADFIIQKGSESGFAYNGAVALQQKASEQLHILLKSDQQQNDEYTIKKGDDGKITIKLENIFDGFILKKGTVNQLWFQETLLRTSVVQNISRDESDEVILSPHSEANNLDACAFEILRLSTISLASIRYSEKLTPHQAKSHFRVRYAKLNSVAEYLRSERNRPYIDPEFENALQRLSNEINWLTPEQKKQFKVESSRPIALIEKYLLHQLLAGPKNKALHPRLQNDTVRTIQKVTFTPLASKKSLDFSPLKLSEYLSPGLYNYLYLILNENNILTYSNDPFFNLLASTYFQDLLVAGFGNSSNPDVGSISPKSTLHIRQLSDTKIEIHLVGHVTNKDGDILFEKSLKVEFEDSNPPDEQDFNNVSFYITENKYTTNNMMALKLRFEHFDNTAKLQAQLQSALNKDISPNEQIAIREAAKALFNQNERPEIFSYIEAVLTKDPVTLTIQHLYKLAKNWSKTGVTLSCTISAINDENILTTIALHGFTPRSRIEAAQKLREINPRKIFTQGVPKNNRVDIAVALLRVTPKNPETDNNPLLGMLIHSTGLTSPTSLEEKFFHEDILAKSRQDPSFQQQLLKINRVHAIFFIASFFNTSNYVNRAQAGIVEINDNNSFNLAITNTLLILNINAHYLDFRLYSRDITHEIFFKNLCIELDLIEPFENDKPTLEYVRILQASLQEAAYWVQQNDTALLNNPANVDQKNDLAKKINFIREIAKTVPVPELSKTSNFVQKEDFDNLLLNPSQWKKLGMQALNDQDPYGAKKYLQDTAHPGFFTRALRKLFWWTEWSKKATLRTQNARKILSSPVVHHIKDTPPALVVEPAVAREMIPVTTAGQQNAQQPQDGKNKGKDEAYPTPVHSSYATIGESTGAVSKIPAPAEAVVEDDKPEQFFVQPPIFPKDDELKPVVAANPELVSNPTPGTPTVEPRLIPSSSLVKVMEETIPGNDAQLKEAARNLLNGVREKTKVTRAQSEQNLSEIKDIRVEANKQYEEEEQDLSRSNSGHNSARDSAAASPKEERREQPATTATLG